MPVKDLDILKTILLREAETETLPQGFEEDPMGFILKKYPGLNEVMVYMMTESFREYVDAIFVVAPKPTTFKILLHNGQFFFLQFMGKTYQATVQGKNYYLMSIGEKERCMVAIARLLRFGNPLKTKGPEGAEKGTRPEGEEGGAGGEAGAEVPEATPEAGGEEGLEESVILSEIIKKSILEREDSENKDTNVKIDSKNTDELSHILDTLGDTNQIKKTELFDKLSEYTYKNYDLGSLRKIFPNSGINTISNWKNYLNKDKNYTNTGKKVEDCIVEYSKQNGVDAKDISGGKGEDALIGDKKVEIKSSKTDKINTQLQTTFYSNDKFYLFVTNTSKENIEVRVVSGKILRQLSFGKELIDKSGETLDQDKLASQIEDGLKKFNFKETILKSLVQGSTEKRETSFNIGNKMKIRFLVFFEPQYGKAREKKSKESTPK